MSIKDIVALAEHEIKLTELEQRIKALEDYIKKLVARKPAGKPKANG